MSDIVASWEVKLTDGVYKIVFEHGSTSGRRVIRVNDVEIFRKDWLFKLVGYETFTLGKKHHCKICIEPSAGFAYDYSLFVDHKPYKKFVEIQSKILKSWETTIRGHEYRITMEKDTLDIYVNGQVVEAFGEFIDGGTENHFEVNGVSCIIRASSSGNKKVGLLYELLVSGQAVPCVEK